MAGAAVPAAGDIGDDDVTNADQETNLENLAEAVRRIAGVGVVTAGDTVISAGVATPTLGLVYVDTEGSTATDNLDRIDPGAYLLGSVIIVYGSAAPARIVTLRHMQGGSGQLSLNSSSNFALSNGFSWIALRLGASIWVEIARGYGTDFAALRSFIGLGTAATLNNGAVNAATLDGIDSTGFLLAGGTAANSTLFGGLATSAFLRADVASLLSILGSIKALGGRFEADVASAAGAPIVALRAGGVARSEWFYDGTSGNATIRLLSGGGGVVAGIRFRSGLIPDYWSTDSASWVPLFSLSDPAPWLDRVRWDKLDSPTEYDSVASYIIHSAALPSYGGDRIYRIQAAIYGEFAGSPNPTYRARIYVGDNGDETDTLIGESSIVTALSPSTPGIAVIDDDFECPAGDFLTLVLTKTNGGEVEVQPSIAGTYTIEKRTYIRAEQIG